MIMFLPQSTVDWLWSVIMVFPDLEVIKHFSYSTKLSTKFQLLIKTKIRLNKKVSCFKSLRCCIYLANKCLNATIVGILHV